MKNTKYLFLTIFSAAAAVLLTGCMKEDIDELRKQQAENADRIAALEAWQTTVNSNITSLQQLVTALEGNDYVTSVVPFTTPAPGGYRITFTKSGEATIWNGAKGEQGEQGQQGQTGATGRTPDIGVKQFPDNSGVYYWTLDGEFITHDGTPTGNKMPVRGEKGDDGDPGTPGNPGNPGADGKTPKVAIGTDGYWYISADGSATGTAPGTGWEPTGVKATGDKGDKGDQGDQGIQGPQGDAIFAEDGVDYESSDDYVEFTLADGTTKIQMPKYKSIAISYSQPGVFIAGQQYKMAYTLAGTTEPTDIRVTNVPNGWTVGIDKNTKEFVITPPTDFSIPSVEFGKATIWLDNGNEIAAMYNLELHNGVNSNTVGAIYYQKGTAAGIVYGVGNGKPYEVGVSTGLVVSLDEGVDLQWAKFNDLVQHTGERGGFNMLCIQWYIEAAVNNKTWSDFPAFEWVDKKNGPSGTTNYTLEKAGVWMLPSSPELKSLYEVWNNDPNTFNSWLTVEGGTPISATFYWSSTEVNINFAWDVSFYSGNADSNNKGDLNRVRAVLAF